MSEGTAGMAGTAGGAVPEGGARAGDAVAGRLLRWLVEQRPAPGARLGDERDLAALLDASRSGLKDALLILRAARVVDVRPGVKGGVFYHPQPARALAGVLERHLGLLGVRQSAVEEALVETECLLAALAARRADEGQREAVRLAAEQGGRHGRPEGATSRDAFHEAVALAAQSPVLALLVAALCEVELNHNPEHGRPQPEVSVVYSHAHIADAIRAGDETDAAHRMRLHLHMDSKGEGS